jgi:hypothetical protein
MNRKAKAALEAAMATLERSHHWGPALKDRLEGTRHKTTGEWILPPESWQEVAEFAAQICQRDALDLAPWEYPPCRVDPSNRRDYLWPSSFPGFSPKASEDGALKLRAKMKAAGISIWHPDPLAALEEAHAD